MYLKGRSSPPTPPQKILSLQYISNYIGKIVQTRRSQSTHCNISQNCVSKCTRLHLSAYSFQNISGENAPGPPGISPRNDNSCIEPWLSLIPRVRARGRRSPTHIFFVLSRLAVETVPSDSPSKFLGLQQSMQVRLRLGLDNLLPLQPGIDRCQS